MKKILSLMLLLMIGAGGMMAQHYYYLYEGQRMPLELNTEYAYLLLNGVDAPAELEARMPGIEVTKWEASLPAAGLKKVEGPAFSPQGQFWAEVRFQNPERSPEAYIKQLDNLTLLSFIKTANPYFANAQDPKIGVSELFFVRLRTPGEFDRLADFAKRTNTQIAGQNRYMANWYVLSCTEKSEGNALEMANYFVETGFFDAAQPDLMPSDLFQCVNDSLFGDQWGLDHTGQNGWTPQEDINACDGWSNWSTGSADVLISVVDHGIDTVHEDLQANIANTGYDCQTATTPSLVRGSHGTACAGIAGAIQNNNKGVSGVCPDCQLLPVSHSLTTVTNYFLHLADGINWSWNNGADVISNSWYSPTLSSVLDDAIDSALTYGRDGLGTIVCFAAGNFNGAVSYPANDNPDVIAVGAMTPCAERKQPGSCDGEGWGSNYGPELDVMAPGVKVPTTDRSGAAGYRPGDYRLDFNGTSSACPHVAGLAGLLISINPCLTHDEVEDIIELTAQKVGTVTYSTTVGRPNGDWNNEMGYGLIDIDAAMAMASNTELLLQNQTITTDTDYFASIIRAGENVDPGSPSGPHVIASPANVTMTATDYIRFEGGFSVALGATLSATVDPNAGCGSSKMAPGYTGTETSGRITPDQPVSPETALENSSIKLYPNPFHDGLTLEYQIGQSEAPVDVRLYNLQGQEVAALLTGQLRTEGAHKERLNLGRTLPEGIYMVKICVGADCQIQKLIRE